MENLELAQFYKDKDILITGGCGSIGSTLLRALLKFDLKRIRIFDQNESAHFHLQQEFKNEKRIRYLVGSVRDKQRLYRAFDQVDIIFHAAAMKHVPLCEYNPFEAVMTNVIGTQNIIEVAREVGVKKVINISTDKAVNPINTMGASKLLGEKLVLAADASTHDTVFASVRFGNVLNSIGSVIPIFHKQIKQGGPVTVTSEKMTRFFMSMNDAVSFVLKVGMICMGREVFILKMPSMKITDLAHAMVQEIAPLHGHDPESIEVTTIGVRPGEKFHESLFTKEEARFVQDLGDMYKLCSWINVPHVIEDTAITNSLTQQEYSSDKVELLSVDQIRQLLRKENF